jgi:hypothetical protein
MEQDLFDKLIGLPALDGGNRQRTSCKVCGGQAFFFDVVDFNKSCSTPEIYPFGMAGVPVPYFRCSVCSFLFTEFFDNWTPQDFARFVYNEDYIKVDGEYAGIRPERLAAGVANRLAGLSELRILDYGSGSGVFADQLRSRGFKYVSSFDPFSNPVRPIGQFDVITCFEVLEHTTSPCSVLADIASLLEFNGCVIFNTSIQPTTIGEIRANWWYVAPRNGHVSIFSRNALAHLGQSEGLILHMGPGASAFARVNGSSELRQVLSLIGRPVHFIQLTAPDSEESLPPEQKTSWHGIEYANSVPFRWTCEAEITWRVRAQPFLPCELIIAIPVLNEVHRGFADQCRLEVGNTCAPLTRDNGISTASLLIEESVDAVVKLVMPKLLRPIDLRPVIDNRALGLAISTRQRARLYSTPNP